MKATNPASGQVIREYAEHDRSEVESRLRHARRAFDQWSRVPLPERAARLRHVAGLLRTRKTRYARLMTDEMGKPIAAAEGEVDKCAVCCEFYADNAARFLKPEEIETGDGHSFIRFDPLGPVLAIMPWNFPFWQVFRFAAPALAAGNVALLKHAGNVPGTALAIEEVFLDAGCPHGVFTTLMIPSRQIPDVIADPTVRAVTLTGSENAGKSVAEHAGRHLKKTVLELGGSDPFIVLADAPVEEVARRAAEARTINTGQSCIAAKRFLVEERVADRFEQSLVEAMRGLVVGDPADRKTQIGPLAREDLRDELHRQVEESVRSGATLLAGGHSLDRAGYFYAPTVLSRVRPGMAAFDEETFGPVAAVVRVRDADDAVELANESRYGLGASVWTADVKRGERLAAEIESGVVFVNGVVQSDPRLPFGGVKQSGYGRELGAFGIREFVNIKTVWSRTGSEAGSR